METSENNNMSELDILKEQFNVLKEKISQQEIVNERLLKAAVKSKTDFFTRFRKQEAILYPLATIIMVIVFLSYKVSLLVVVAFVSVMSMCLWYELRLTRDIHNKAVENCDLTTLLNNTLKAKRRFRIYYLIVAIVTVMFLLVFLFALFHQHADDFESYISQSKLADRLAIAVCLIVVISVFGYFEINHRLNGIVRQIENPDDSSDNSFFADEGFAKHLRIFGIFGFISFCLGVITLLLKLPGDGILRLIGGFCLAIFAVLLMLFLHKRKRWNWLATLVGIALLLALDLFMMVAVSSWSLERLNIYERLENDTTIANTLAIWEVKNTESDAPVWQRCAMKDTAAVMAALSKSDSVVYCWGMASPKDSIYLYALRKTTPSGPALDNQVLGNKPIVKRSYVQNNAVLFDMTESAAAQFHLITQKGSSSEKPYYIAIVVDNVVYSAPRVISTISTGSCNITANFTESQAIALAREVVRN